MSLPDRGALRRVHVELERLRADLVAAAPEGDPRLAAVHPRHRRSAENLLHYVALRQHDIRTLQADLAGLGLSSLGRCEPHVLATVDAVLDVVRALLGQPALPSPGSDAIALGEGMSMLAANASRLLGPEPATRSTRIMVTLPSAAADDPDIARSFTLRGMDLARVNCAHDGPEAWGRMAVHVRTAAMELGRRVLVAADLAGPKLRTGPIEPGPAVVKVSPRRDDTGWVTAPGRIWFGLAGRPVAAGVEVDAAVPVEEPGFVRERRDGDRLVVTDARGRRRRLEVVLATADGFVATTDRTVYLVPGTALRARRGDGGKPSAATVGDLPDVEQAHEVRVGDTVLLTRSTAPAPVSPRRPAPDAPVVHRIGCTLPEVFDAVRLGDAVWFDDGKLGGVVDRVGPDSVAVVVQWGGARTKLRGGKGINLPDTELDIPALTAKDVDDLAFVVDHADLVQASFVRRPADVADLQDRLAALGAERLGVVLKIETRAAFEALPELLLTALRSDTVGVMIARGDLAVEVGFERLAEVQEEILWLCEAAHVPVIWATQVLDSLARTGRPSRAEVTDAAMAQRAECVMLNKGPHIDDAIATLSDILERMADHQQKKRSLLRRLRSWN